MSAYDWATPHGALVAAISATSGALATNGQTVASDLETAGEAYDQRWAAVVGVDAAKTAWLSAAEAAWDDADAVARHILDAFESVPLTPLAFDGYNRTALASRVASARGKAPSTVLERAAGAALATLLALWDPQRRYPVSDGLDAYLAAEVNRWSHKLSKDSVRHLELVAAALVADAASWTEAVTP